MMAMFVMAVSVIETLRSATIRLCTEIEALLPIVVIEPLQAEESLQRTVQKIKGEEQDLIPILRINS